MCKPTDEVILKLHYPEIYTCLTPEIQIHVLHYSMNCETLNINIVPKTTFMTSAIRLMKNIIPTRIMKRALYPAIWDTTKHCQSKLQSLTGGNPLWFT